jgi:hypothetical protein
MDAQHFSDRHRRSTRTISLVVFWLHDSMPVCVRRDGRFRAEILMETAQAVCVVSVQFPGQQGKSYDYLSPFPVEVGQLVVVSTKRGEATVEVVAVKAESEVATKSILRVAEKERDF